MGRHVDERKHVEEEAVTVTSPIEFRSNPLLKGFGPGRMDAGSVSQHVSGAVMLNEVQDVEQGCVLGLDYNLDPNAIQPVSSIGAATPKKLMIENLDQMISITCGNQQPERSSFLSDENPISVAEAQLSQGRQGKFYKVHTPFPHMFGPRCLRFAGVINNSASVRKQRKSTESESLALVSQIQAFEDEDCVAAEQGESLGLVVGDSTKQVEVEQHHNSQGLDLSVCLPFPVGNASSSGVRQLLNEDTIKDVDGFILARDDPETIDQEARKLLANQQELGFNFDQMQDLPVDRMVTMEVRDRGKLPIGQESNGLQ
jgi:hypothetical protein